mmetsp:Transcript_30343/g.28986  ORF Transcript_30343/g.28986 Transcript_30343/m.28986 type:complete len:128 (-) Transcript_30343:1275-1658(-)
MLIPTSFLDQSFNLFRRHTTFIILYGNFLLISVSFIKSTNLKNSICINLKSNLNLRSSSWTFTNTIQIESTHSSVILRHRSFALIHHNRDTCLIIFSSSKNFGFFGRNRGVSFKNTCHHIILPCLNA